jgi:nucleoside phosphorylase
MLLIAAALADEIGVVREFCRDFVRLAPRQLAAWQATLHGTPVYLLKCGIGPERSARNLASFLKLHPVSRIFAYGYAGAADPELRIGDVVIARRAILIAGSPADGTPLERMETAAVWELSPEQFRYPEHDERLSFCFGDIVTSPFILGTSSQKRQLREKFGAAAVDMETAALAGVADNANIPFGCARVITDDTEDRLLAPFSYDPASTTTARALKIVTSGRWISRYGEWTRRTALAKASLHEFLKIFLPDAAAAER